MEVVRQPEGGSSVIAQMVACALALNAAMMAKEHP